MRIAFKMAIKDGFSAEYKKRHDPIWQDLKKMFMDHGVKSYSIFMDPDSNYLFGYVEVSSIDLWRRIASTKVCKEWWDYMAPIMLVNEDNSPTSVDLEEVFHFSLA